MLLVLLIKNFWSQIHFWREISRQRRDLRNLSDCLLKDVGLSRIDADREASRPFRESKSGNDPTLRRRGQFAASVQEKGNTIHRCSQH